MIDLHTHILPGLDDGAKSMEEALAMARCASEGGISAMVATPHVITGLYPNTKENILEAVARLNDFLGQHGLSLQVLPGAEYRLEPDLPERLARDELLTLNEAGRYLLVEFPADSIPPFTGRVFYELLLNGIVPVIAHPERNARITKNPSLLYHMISRGALAQLTAGSLSGHFGSRAANAARLFLEHGCAHFIASDTHSPRNRVPDLTGALDKATRILGAERAAQLVRHNPRAAVQGNSIATTGLKAIRPTRRGLLSRLFGR